MNAKTIKGILYGVAIAIAMSATAATVYNYFPPPGMTYSPTAGLVIGTATGGSQGTGTVNAQGVFVNGAAVVTGSGLPVGANPTGTVGLTAVNGSATTFMRSDAAPPLSQAISPTWTGTHVFNGAPLNTVATSGWTLGQVSNRPNMIAIDTNGATDSKVWQWVTSGGTDMIFRIQNDAASVQANIWDITRSGATITGMSFGNATNNPTYTFLGTGQMNISSGVVVGGATGGNKGAGTINAVGLYVGGVAVGTGGSGTVTSVASGTGLTGGPITTTGTLSVDTAVVPLLAANNVFTAGGTAINATGGDIISSGNGAPTLGTTNEIVLNGGNSGQIIFSNGTGAVDTKGFDCFSGGTDFYCRIVSDSLSSAVQWLDVNRTGLTVNSVSFPAGGVVIGAPTGGSQGAGTVNATALYQNGSKLAPVVHLASCYVTQSGTTATLNNIQGCSSITRSSTGTYTLNFTAGTFTASRPACSIIGYGNSLIYSEADPSNNTTIQIIAASTTGGTTADGTGFFVNCSGN